MPLPPISIALYSNKERYIYIDVGDSLVHIFRRHTPHRLYIFMTLMYYECMTNDTSMLRISNNLHKALKAEATRQGRTLEWMVNDAIRTYLDTPIHPTQTRVTAIEPRVIYTEELPQLPA